MRAIQHLKKVRVLYEKACSGLTDEQLFQVPDGFKNHIAWNAAHAVVTQQLLHYKLSGLELYLGPDLVERYSKGAGPEQADLDSYRAVIDFMHRGPELLEIDHAAGRFESFNSYETSAGVRLESVDDAIEFNNIHEGIHLGIILAQRKLVS